MEGKPPAEPSPKEILPVEDLVSLQRISLQRLPVLVPGMDRKNPTI
jgi:hypothetical protein